MYPRAVGVIVEWSPLYQGVVMLRDLVVGSGRPIWPGGPRTWPYSGWWGWQSRVRRIAKLLLV